MLDIRAVFCLENYLQVISKEVIQIDLETSIMSSTSMSLRVPLPKHLQPIDELFLVLIRLQLEQDLSICNAVVTQVWINQELTCNTEFSCRNVVPTDQFFLCSSCDVS